MTEKKEIKTFARKLALRLKEKGFTVQWYQSQTTNSVYLKLDYGVAHSVRISDHKSQSGMKYRYNITKGVTYKKIYRVDAKQAGWRFFAPFSCLDEMIDIIVKEKKSKIRFWGKQKYDKAMTVSYIQNEGKPGFWSKYKFI